MSRPSSVERRVLAATELRRVLWISLSGIGDTILQLPALEALRAHLPQAEIVALTRLEGSRELLEASLAVDRVVHDPMTNRRAVWRVIRSLRAPRFDASFLGYPSNRAEYNLLSRLIGARIRVATRYLHRDRRSLGFLHARAYRELERVDRYAAYHNLELLACLGISAPPSTPRIQLSAEAIAVADAWIQAQVADRSRPWIAVHAGCSTFKNHTSRRWPIEHFAELGRALRDATILILGGEASGEAELNRALCVAIGSHAVEAPTPSFLTACALLRHCDLFVGNDGSLFHAAAAVGTPTIGIFGPTNARHVASPEAHVRVVSRELPCSPCFVYSPKPLQCRFAGHDAYACLRGLPVETVFRRVRAMLGAGSASGASRNESQRRND